MRKLGILAVLNLHKGMGILKRGTAVVCFQASLAKTVVRDIPPVINSVSLFQTYKYLDSSRFKRNACTFYEIQTLLIQAHTPSQLVITAVTQMTHANISSQALIPS